MLSPVPLPHEPSHLEVALPPPPQPQADITMQIPGHLLHEL